MIHPHIQLWLEQVNDADWNEGLRAYGRYHRIMRALAAEHDFRLERVTAAFVSLSPNTDYLSNLRSLKTLLAGIRAGQSIEEIQVSTYRHGLQRAWNYAQGHKDFLNETKGPKVRAFYHNVNDPNDPKHVTVDGHIVCIWRNQNLTMKEALVKNLREYHEISEAIMHAARILRLVPCQLQAILWFTRKRVLGIKHEAQLNLWAPDEPSMLEPYARRSVRSDDLEERRA